MINLKLIMKNSKLNIRFYFILLALTSFMSCKQVVLKIDEVPANTPEGAAIFVAGNFNYWDGADARFKMQMLPDSSYIIELPRMTGLIEYRFTRGDWYSVEADRCGNEIANRMVKPSHNDTISHTIESWSDLDPINCDSITIVVNKIPKKTPDNEPLKIAGSFNAWNPGDNSEYQLKKDSANNRYLVTVPRISYKGKASNILTYKFVREDITIAEVDKFGREIDPRVLNFEKGDSVFVEIENWIDLAEPAMNTVTIVLKKVPSTTPQNDYIYLVGNFNDWNPADSRYRFKTNKNGQLFVTIPRDKYGLSFKITRGCWDSEFADKCGRTFNNQDYNYDEIDTLYYTVENWKDLESEINPFITLVVNKYPANTPKDATLKLQTYALIGGEDYNEFTFLKNINSQFVCKVHRNRITGEYVILRGGYISQEVENDGYFVEPRTFANNCSDTIYLQVENWNDLFGDEKLTRIIVKKIPKRTSIKDDIFITGQFNGWNPGDINYRLDNNENGEYVIKMPSRWLKQGFKFTRGNWRKVEADEFNDFIEDRVLNKYKPELFVEIEGWEDAGIF